MSTTTTNYGLIKPGTDDPILVGQLNDNMDTIDTVLKDHSDKIDAASLGIKYKGEVNYYADLPNSAEIGDAYTVKYSGTSGTTPDGTEYVWGTVSGTNQWINFSKDSYTKAEVDALLALKVDTAGTGLSKSGTTLNHSNSTTAKTTQGFAQIAYDAQGHITGSTAATTAQANAINSGIDSTKVEQIETNKNNILTLEQANGSKNVVSNHTGWDVPAELSASINSNGSVTITANTTSNKILIITSDLQNMLENGTEYVLSGSDGGDFNSSYALVISNSNFSSKVIEGTGSTTFTANSADHINLTLIVRGGQSWTKTFYPMIYKKSMYDAGFTDYQPYAMSNVELTAAIQAIQAQLANQ